MENLSHSRPPAKLSSTNAAKRACNGGSFAGKNTYGDVFGGPPRFGTPSLSPRPEDYSEIFGGFHASRATSIPVLDLPVVEDEVVCFDVRSSGFDYGEVFGGFDGLDFPASFEELMRQANGGGDHDRDGDSSDEAWTPAETECLSDESDLSGEDQYSLNGDSYEPINSSMKFNISYHKTDQGRNQDMYKGVTPVAELHTLPEYAHAFEETIPLDKAHGQNPDVNVTNGDVNLEFPARRKREKHVSKMSNLRNGAVDEAMTTENLESKSGYARAESRSDQGFVTISEISLRTQPSDVPPPTRRPPMLDSNKVDCWDSQTTDSGKRAGDDSPPYFDVEIDAASAAAAIREAMENAQAKFRSTKELMQRKRDGVQNHKIFPSKHDRMDKKTEKLRIITDESCDMDYKLLQRACEKGKSQEKISINDGGIAMITKMLPGSIEGEGHFNVSKKCMEDKHASKLQSSRGLYDISVADEWHEAAQFFELVRTDNLVSEQVREETLLLQNPKIHEPQQKAEKIATEALKQQREIGEVTTVRLDNDLEKIERDLRLAKEAFWRPETKGRSEVEKQAVRIKVNEKKLGVPQDLSKLEENSTKSITTQHLSERGKRIAEANEAEKCGRIEIRLADSELEIDKVRTYTTCEDPKFQQKHGKLVEMPEKGYERKLVVDSEQSANDKMLKKSLEQEEKERRLKEVRRREERKKKEREDHERGEKVQKERQAHLQEEEKKRREVREREEKEKREVEIREREEKEKKEQELREAKQKEERELQRREEQEKEENAARKKEEEKRKRDALEREEWERKEMEAHKMEEEKRVREALIQHAQNVKVTEACNLEEDEKRKRVLKREEQERKEREASKKEEVGKKESERLEGEENERKLREAFEKEENARKEKEWRELEEEMIWKMALEQLENEKIIVKQNFWPSGNEEKKIENLEEEVLEKIQNQAHKIEEKEGIQTADLLKNGKPHGGKVNIAEIGRRQDHEKETNSVLEEACGKDGIGRINTEFQRKEETINLGVIDDEHVRGKEALDGDSEKKLEDETVHEEMREVKGEGDSYCSSQREQIMKNIKTAECNGDLGLEEKCLKVTDGAMGQDTYTKVDDAINHCETKTQTKLAGDEASINQRDSEEIMSTSRVGCNPENKRSKFTNEHSGGDMDATSNQLRKSENPVSMQAWKESIEAGKKAEAAQSFYSEGKTNVQKVSQQVKTNQAAEKKDNNIREMRAAGQAARIKKEREMEMERLKKMEEAREREREREKDRMPVDKLTLEARDRAYAESRERKERTAVDRATPEAKNRTLAEARERLEKASSEAREKSYTEARLRADRTVVDRADARERALGKAMAERASADTNERIGRSLSDIYSSSRNNEMRDNKDHQFQRSETFSGSRFPASSSYSGVEGESAQRCKARLDRYRRTAERAAKALAEKNMRDLLAQKEQAERHRLAETLDADVKRWSSGKEGNLRALLSTLQYILGPDSGWQPIPLTEVITSAAVKRAYRKATLCVHPDKLQQRGASIQQKYICEKVFDLLKEAWNKFSSEER